jgi:hypothetical protein
MEALVLALITVRSLYTQQGRLGPETEEFQPFDLQALRHLYDAEEKSASRLSDRQASYVAQAAS